MNENEENKFDNFDLICICYEKPVDLMRFLEEYHQLLPRFIPKLSVRTKVDVRGNHIRGEHYKEISEVYGLKCISEFSSKDNYYKDLLRGITEVFENP